MTFLEELKIFLKHIAHWIFYFAAFSFFFFLFGLKKLVIFGNEYFLPLPTENSFSVQIFNQMRRDLLPPGVELVTTNPMSAFTSQVSFSLLLGFLSTIPLFTYKIIMYLRPALLSHERKAVIWSLLPFVLLFFSGALFSYFILIPTTFRVLYPYATAIGAVPFFAIDEFTYYVFGLTMAGGILFLLPLFMIFLSVMEIIPAEVWRKNWRYAYLFFLILSAIITPDGTGITMMILFLPLAALYYAGYAVAGKLSS